MAQSLAQSRAPVSVAETVARFLAKRHGLSVRGHEAASLKVFAAFTRIGPPISERAEPITFRRGLLTLVVEDSTWLTELTFLKPDIVVRLNKALGRALVQDLRLRLGSLSHRARTAEELAPPLTPRQEGMLQSWGDTIKNPAIRDTVLRAARVCIATGRTKILAPIATGPPGPRPQCEPPPTRAAFPSESPRAHSPRTLGWA